jgi:outer membrane receptor for ferrienterochelin and colicin
MLFGLSAGLDLRNTKQGGEKVVDHRYREFAFDFRAHFDLSEELCLTTMNNLSVLDTEKAKDQKYDVNTFHLWDMVSLSYKANDKIKAQLTAEAECDLLRNQANSANDGTETKNVRDLGGFTLSVIPGFVYSFNQNASLTAGFKFQFAEIGASTEFQDSDHTITTKISIPVVFAVAL